MRPGSPSGPGSPCRRGDHIMTSDSLLQAKREGFSAHSCALTLRPMSPLGPLWPGSPRSPGSPWHEKEKVTRRSARKYLASVVHVLSGGYVLAPQEFLYRPAHPFDHSLLCCHEVHGCPSVPSRPLHQISSIVSPALLQLGDARWGMAYRRSSWSRIVKARSSRISLNGR